MHGIYIPLSASLEAQDIYRKSEPAKTADNQDPLPIPPLTKGDLVIYSLCSKRATFVDRSNFLTIRLGVLSRNLAKWTTLFSERKSSRTYWGPPSTHGRTNLYSWRWVGEGAVRVKELTVSEFVIQWLALNTSFLAEQKQTHKSARLWLP